MVVNLLTVQVDSNIPKNLLEKAISKEIANNLINIIKESLNNIRKHAKASLVHIKFNLSDDQCLICIEDNGIGFDIKYYDNTNKKKFGLNIMRARGEELGGRVEIDTNPGKGTTVKIVFPHLENI